MHSRMAWKPFLVFVAIALLPGCDRGAHGGMKATVDTYARAAAANGADGTSRVASGPATLSVVPASVALCKSASRPRGIVLWQSGGIKKVRLTVSDPQSGAEKPFGKGGPTGQKSTGPWLKPGLVFRLRDASSNTELASTTIKATPCR